ncbi:hypothetical protein QCE63_21765 [Caballeronia sp. LZ065]|uniref:hypothetical protein n=1 Tax=Caballeronia sp. LZ065 TaxID=3038571 RepID=UPI002861AFCE|nr:hypothetical protein [Caballeronia sp. LZ065]MDR5782030.1 hypothetical protein [Caballeronia sp. LZ065]
MEKETNQLAGESVSGSNGPTSSELKARFEAGSVPLDTDFAALIDMAECGRRAVGQSADQTSNTVGQGLQIAADSDAANKGKLSVKLAKGLVFEGGGIRVGEGSAINVSDEKVSVQVGVGCEIASDAVCVKADKYIKVSASGVTVDVDALFPMGMIVAINVTKESDIPAGWALCDGRAVTMRTGATWHTPDLRDRFIIGGTPGEITRKGGSTWTWTDSNHTAGSFSSATDTAASNIKVGDHTLTTENLSSHTHDLTLMQKDIYYTEGDTHLYFYSSIGDRPNAFEVGWTGEGKSFSHTVTDSKHSHTVSVTPPFQVLAYFMKL